MRSTAAVVAGLGVSLMVGRTGRPDPWGLLGAAIVTVGLTEVVIAAVMVWRPVSGIWTNDSRVIVDSYIEGDPPTTLPELHRELARRLGDHAERNQDGVQERIAWAARALPGFVVEIVGLVIMGWATTR